MLARYFLRPSISRVGLFRASILPRSFSSVDISDADLAKQFLWVPEDRYSSRVAVLLAGCGVYDGSEVHETSAALIALSRLDCWVRVFAPDKMQMHAIDHTNGSVHDANRHVLTESARLARGKVSALKELNVKEFSALIIPGGFGAAKNLCDFATAGAEMNVDPDVEEVVSRFFKAKKPIGMCCIAPVLAAKLIHGCQLTMGQESSMGGMWPHSGAIQEVKKLGAQHQPRDVADVFVDQTKLLVTSPAFMAETHWHKVADGVTSMVNSVVRSAKRSSSADPRVT